MTQEGSNKPGCRTLAAIVLGGALVAGTSFVFSTLKSCVPDVLMPDFPNPEEARTNSLNEYQRHLIRSHYLSHDLEGEFPDVHPVKIKFWERYNDETKGIGAVDREIIKRFKEDETWGPDIKKYLVGEK